MAQHSAFEKTVIGRRIESLKTRIDAVRPLPAEAEARVMQKLRLDWNYHSNAIEGNSLDHGETRAFLMHGITAKGKPLKDYLDIRGHNEAIGFLEDVVRNEETLRESDLRALHKVVLVEPYDMMAVAPDGSPTKRRIHLGSYKSGPNSVQTSTGEVHHFASPEETPALMGDLMKWLYDDGNTLHPVERAVSFHHRFVAIHPFDDGNGRMGRLLMNLLLMQGGYPPAVIRNEKRGEYYAALAQADDGRLGPLLEFVGEALIRSMELYVRASRNEPIDEPDDLDKEIFLLEQDLETRGQRIDARDDAESRIRFVEEVLRPIWSAALRSLSKFERLFLSTRRGLLDCSQARYDRGELQYEIFTADSLEQRFEELVHDVDIRRLAAFAQLRDFRDLVNHFSVELRLVVEFGEFSASVGLWVGPADDLEGLSLDPRGLTNAVTQIEVRYRNDLSELELRDVVRSLERSLLEYVKRHDSDPHIDELSIEEDEFRQLLEVWAAENYDLPMPEQVTVQVEGRTLLLDAPSDFRDALHRQRERLMKRLIDELSLGFHPRLMLVELPPDDDIPF
ncbi:MAG: Fic family protein [Nannocystaceae bacterium]